MFSSAFELDRKAVASSKEVPLEAFNQIFLKFWTFGVAAHDAINHRSVRKENLSGADQSH